MKTRQRAMMYTLTPVVMVEVLGYKLQGEDQYTLRHDDDNLIKRLLQWLCNEKIYSVYGTGGTVGGGLYIHYHTAEDAERIAVWLKDNGARVMR